VQLLYFQPSFHQDLGFLVSADFSYDNTHLVAVFSSGKIDIFKQQPSIDFIKKAEVFRHQLNNNGVVVEAEVKWTDLGDGRHQLFIFYRGIVTVGAKRKEVSEKEIAVFIGELK